LWDFWSSSDLIFKKINPDEYDIIIHKIYIFLPMELREGPYTSKEMSSNVEINK
jgi:hypothetical protein